MTKRPRPSPSQALPASETARAPRRHNAKLSHIMTTARRLFLTKGFDAMTMDIIAGVAGVSKATLYARFKSKEDLFSVVMEEEAKRINEGIWQGVDEHGEIKEVLRQIGRNFCAVLINERMFMMQRAAIGTIARFPKIGHRVYQSGPVKLIAKISSFLERAVEDGRLKIDRPVMAAGHFIDLVRGDADLRGLLALELPPQSEMDHRVEMAVKIFLSFYGPDTAKQ